MTIVVAVSKGSQTVMAADTLTLFGDSQRVSAANSTTVKVRRIGSALIGAAGWGVYDCILDNFLAQRPRPDLRDERSIFAFFLELWSALHEKYPFVNDQAQGKDSPFGDLDTSFLIATGSGIFKVSHDLDVFRFRQYCAIGSGADYALGALYNLYDDGLDAETIARRAVTSAIQFDVHCGGEIDVMKIDGTWAKPQPDGDAVPRPMGEPRARAASIDHPAGA